MADQTPETAELLKRLNLTMEDVGQLAQLREFLAQAAVAAVARGFVHVARCYALASKAPDEEDRRARLTITLDLARPSDWTIVPAWKATYPAAVKGELPPRAMNQPELPLGDEP